MRRSFYFFLLIILFTSCSKKKKQNFVFILVDDLGWTDLGYSGSTFYETPNIDVLSKMSVQFNNAYASGSVCSPSRASIMTGQHPARINITDWIPGNDPQNEKLLGPDDLDELPIESTTLAEALKEHGYQTFFAGKWHLGDEGFFPQNQGFDFNFGGHHMGQPPGGYYSPYKNPQLTDGPEGEYLTDRLTDESIHFLDNRNQNPFFLFLSYYTVHTPIQACKRHLEKFENKLQSIENKAPRIKIEGDGKTTIDQLNPAYASMIYALDENIGRLIKKLKEDGLYDNTTIIFTSDNGGLSTVLSRYKNNAPTSVRPLRAGKGWLYEGGIRVPLLIKPRDYHTKNRVCTEPVIGHDFYPTLLSMAGIKKDENMQIDGIDLSDLLEKDATPEREEIFWHYPHYHGSAWKPGAAIRQGDWKLIEFYETNTVELYNLSEDISESNDLSMEFTDKVKALQLRLHELQKSINAKQAIPNPDFTQLLSFL